MYLIMMTFFISEYYPQKVKKSNMIISNHITFKSFEIVYMYIFISQTYRKGCEPFNSGSLNFSFGHCHCAVFCHFYWDSSQAGIDQNVLWSLPLSS